MTPTEPKDTAAASDTPTIVAPLPIPIAALVEQVAPVVASMETAQGQLPLDDNLPTPRAVEANMVRRSLLNTSISQGRIIRQRCQELEPTLVMRRDWCDTLRECAQDMANELTEAEAIALENRTLRASTRVDQLRQSLADVANGPELVSGSGEFMTDILAAWFADHGVGQLPGESGIFAGRGGLHSATARLDKATSDLEAARADLERWLHAAQQLVSDDNHSTRPTTGERSELV